MNVIGFLISNGRGAGTSTEVLAKNILAHAITATNYWSSTENSTNNAWNVNFSNGNINNNNKYNGNAVRAVAALDEETKLGWVVAYHDCCANKKSSYECNEYRMHCEIDLWLLIYQVYSREYKPGKSTCFVVTRPKLREVFAASFRDRIVHHWICLRLNPLFEERFNDQGNVSHNCRRGFGTSSAVSAVKVDTDTVTQNYTREAYIGRFDVQAFFMSIDPKLLWELLRPFIIEKYKGSDIDTLLYLTETVLMNRPQDNCIKKSVEELYEALPPGKSLFNSDTGVPIGNLPSQLFANFLMSFLDEVMAGIGKMLSNDFRYERYVDDFIVICAYKEIIVSLRPIVEGLLLEQMRLTLHPDKFYLQEAKKGAAFVGCIVKQGRVYLSNRTVHGLHDALERMQSVCLEIVTHGANTDRLTRLEHCASSVNSYLGFTIHCDAYNVRKKVFAKLADCFWEVCYMKDSTTLSCVKIKKQYRVKEYLIEKEIKDYDLVLRKREARRTGNSNKTGPTSAHN